MPSESLRARSRKRKFKNLRRHLRYYGMLPFIALLSRLPLGLARRVGRGAGTLGWLFARSDRLRAMENLREAFGKEKSPRELRRICRGVFRNVAVNMLELLVVHRWPPEKIRRAFPLEEDFRKLDEYFRGGSVGLTAHLGSWEMLGVLFGAFFPGRIVPLAKRIYFKKFQDLVERFRKRVRLEVIYTDESPRRILKCLKDGKTIGILADQDIKALNGVFVEFFGRPAYTPTLPVNLALSTGKSLSLTCLVREGDGFRVLHRPISVTRTGRREEDLLENTQRWTRQLEEDIREHIDQWVWFHRRWRTRPEEGPRRDRKVPRLMM